MRFSVVLILLLAVAGCGTPSFLVTPVSNRNQLQEHVVQEGQGWSAPKILIVEVEGMLANAAGGGFLQPTENPVSRFAQELDRAAKDSAVKAIVVRINSPGGTVSASDTMYQLLKDFKTKTHKPIIAAPQDIAASGGYYVALAADKIVAHPTSVIGSIGVIFNTFDVEGTLGKLGVRSVAIKSGPMKDMASPFHRLSDEERAVMQAMVDDYYARFVDVLKTNRPDLAADKMTVITDGRVFSGEMAKTLGLVDETGQLADAITLAKKLANASNAKVILYKRPYGYSGSIYADTRLAAPRVDTIKLELPFARAPLPTGFYYLWGEW